MNITSMTNAEAYEILTGQKPPMTKGAADIAVLGQEGNKRRSDEFTVSGDMDFNDPATMMFIKADCNLRLGKGCKNGVPDEKRLGEYFGGIAKRLDEAYAAGKFTEEEYDGLNKLLSESIEKRAQKAERAAAFYSLGREKDGILGTASAASTKKEQSQSIEDYMELMNQRLDEYASEHCRIDRELIMSILNSVRYGA
ncbi:hypothetical protein [Huintestinicola sp.]|uniref:hypothetical protein n=1 Tax=Huintestinicola sp. TaxID=2981661 RepID=UPI003D7F0150